VAQIEIYSETWLAVKEWAESEREDLTRLLIAENDEEIRGRIKQIDELLDLPGRAH
jgi:hypothetical protein